jgi:predicted Zn-dependent protease
MAWSDRTLKRAGSLLTERGLNAQHTEMARQIRQSTYPSYRNLCAAMLLVLIPAIAHSQASAELTLGDRLAREYEEEVGLGHTSELESISNYISSVGNRVASSLPSSPLYHFIFDPNPDFKSAFALPGRYIIVGGGLLALTQTEDELASALAHEIEHVELGQVSGRVTELTKQKDIKNLRVSEFFPGYTKQEELACDLNGQKLAAKAGYSPAGMLTLLETFKALRKGQPEPPSKEHPLLSERIAQAEPLANASDQKQTPLRIP